MKRKISELGSKEGILCKTKELFLKIIALPGAEACSILRWEWNEEQHVIFPADRSHMKLSNADESQIIYPASDFLEEDKKDKELSHYNIS